MTQYVVDDEEILNKIAEFCQRRGIRELALFGSALRDDFGPDSDVDVLVQFEQEHVPGFLGLAGMEFDLADMPGGTVDLRTPEDLSEYFRDRVVGEAVTQYVA